MAHSLSLVEGMAHSLSLVEGVALSLVEGVAHSLVEGLAHSLVEGVACQEALQSFIAKRGVYKERECIRSLSGSKSLQKPSGIPSVSREMHTGE